MEFDEVSVGVRLVLAVDGAVNLFAMLDQAASRHPHRGAMYHGTRRLYTWIELRDRALRLAASIRKQHAPVPASRSRPTTVPRSSS